MTYQFYLHGEMVTPKDARMKQYCKIRPNYCSIRLSSGDYQIFRAWINAKGKPAQIVIYPSVGSADHEHIVRELNRQAKQHFSKRLYQTSSDDYMKYAISKSSVYACLDEIKHLKVTPVGKLPVHEATRREYVARLEQWLDFTFRYEKQKFVMLLDMYDNLSVKYSEWKHADFLKLQAKTNISEQEYNEKLFTLMAIFQSFCRIQLFERLIGYYLKADCPAFNEE